LVDYQIHHLEMFNGKTLNAGGGLKISFSLQELTKLCEEVTGNKITINKVKENRVADVRIYITDHARITKLCGWVPKRDLRQIVTETFEWMKLHEQNLKKILN
ncbi:MAG: 3-beta hydroxysteroid dehydrogenase, partial [Bacteroidia bacterium]